MLTSTGTDLTARIGVSAVLSAQWHGRAGRAWSYAVYYCGYRLLSMQLSCGSLAVSGIPFVMKFAT